MTRRMRTATTVIAGTIAASVALAGGAAAGQTRTRSVTVSHARQVARVAGVDPGAVGTSLEGAAFDSRGRFYFVDTTAAPGRPKLLTMNLATHRVRSLYTDATSTLNCVGFAPGGAMYLCDLYGGGGLLRFDPASHTASPVLRRADGRGLRPDDVAVDRRGDVFITDYYGSPGDAAGRIVERRADGRVETLRTRLVHPNGIALTRSATALWVDEDLSGRLDRIAIAGGGRLHVVHHVHLGADRYADSLTTDGAGNVYMAVDGAGEVLEFDPAGRLVGRVLLPADAPRVTHVAIRPGTREAYVTSSGPAGGYVDAFTAIAPAPRGQPNGG